MEKIADGTPTLFRNKFKYTMETKNVQNFIGKKVFKHVIWRSSPFFLWGGKTHCALIATPNVDNANRRQKKGKSYTTSHV
jgi:hypothetical protein